MRPRSCLRTSRTLSASGCLARFSRSGSGTARSHDPRTCLLASQRRLWRNIAVARLKSWTRTSFEVATDRVVPQGIRRLAVSRFGAVELLVTNTGGPPAARFLDLTEAQWREGIEGVLFNVVRLCRLVLPDMRKRCWGRIVHLTSLAATQPIALLTVSSTLRAGLSALTKTMSNEFSREGVLVNALLPGHVLTDRQIELNEIRSKQEGISIEDYASRVQGTIPIRRYGPPREIGEVVAFLASARASYVTGATIQVDGGLIQGTF